MNYDSLANKHRPETLDDMLIDPTIRRMIELWIIHKRLPVDHDCRDLWRRQNNLGENHSQYDFVQDPQSMWEV